MPFKEAYRLEKRSISITRLKHGLFFPSEFRRVVLEKRSISITRLKLNFSYFASETRISRDLERIRVNGIHALNQNQRYEVHMDFTGYEPGMKPLWASPPPTQELLTTILYEVSPNLDDRLLMVSDSHIFIVPFTVITHKNYHKSSLHLCLRSLSKFHTSPFYYEKCEILPLTTDNW